MEGVARVAGETLEERVVEVVLRLPVRGERGEDVVVEGAGGPAKREEGGVGEVEAYFVEQLERELLQRHEGWVWTEVAGVANGTKQTAMTV